MLKNSTFKYETNQNHFDDIMAARRQASERPEHDELPRVLLIKTGGTVAQKPDDAGILRPSDADYLSRIDGISNMAGIGSGYLVLDRDLVKNLARLDVIDLGLLDSTNMETISGNGDDRASIARTIHENAYRYDGFVVVHGTDTMAETAAALTYMLPGFRKPIALTGAQNSIWVAESDAGRNIRNAIKAATMDIGEVVVVFGDNVWRGTRVKKVNEQGFNAFISPGVHPLGTMTALSNSIDLADHRVRRSHSMSTLFVDFDINVFHYSHVSGSQTDSILNYAVSDDGIHGIILAGYGAGNIPDRLLIHAKNALALGKPVIVYTSCDTGAADMGIYSVGTTALDLGVESAGDMTFEALGQKLMFALGQVNAMGTTGAERLFAIDALIKTPFNFDITVTEKRV